MYNVKPRHSSIQFYSSKRKFPSVFNPQSKWITDISGQVIVDEVFKIEELELHIGELCRRFELVNSLGHLNSRKTQGALEYCTESRQIISKIYSR